MVFLDPLLQDHLQLTRRHWLGLGLAGLAGTRLAWGSETSDADLLAAATKNLAYLTKPEDFGTVERGNPLPYTHPEEKLKEVGLTRETWRLEVLADPDSNSQIAQPLSREKGTALTFDSLLKLAETKAVRVLKVMTCNNGNQPLGMGLWEGVPLRDVVWLAQPTENVRRLYYYGYHNDEPAQRFQSSLSIGRVLEDPPGDHPILLCYKLNGEWLSGKRGGPVRMLVPEAYGFKSVKWLQRVMLTNNHQANDTYAGGNNDIDSWMKTFARFLAPPAKGPADAKFAVTGVAQVGISGLSKVQVWLRPKGTTAAPDDPHYDQAPWQEATLLNPPTNWGGGLPEGALPAPVRGIQPDTGRPDPWPARYTIVHWAAVLPATAAGEYEIGCRTLDAHGVAQPRPRPFPKSGRNSLQFVPITLG